MEPTLRNPARERLEAGELALGAGIRQSRTVVEAWNARRKVRGDRRRL